MAFSIDIPDTLEGAASGKFGSGPLVAPIRDISDEPMLCPFTVIVDTAEGHPFTFTGLRADAKHKYRPLMVHLEHECLGRYPDSLGDYSIKGWEGRCHIERKSLEDAHGTFLGFAKETETGTSRRERFESELANLSAIELGIVVVEATFEQVVANAPATPKRMASDNQKYIARSIMAWQRKYGAKWMFLDGRRAAEEYVFWQLWGFWNEHREKKKVVRKQTETNA